MPPFSEPGFSLWFQQHLIGINLPLASQVLSDRLVGRRVLTLPVNEGELHDCRRESDDAVSLVSVVRRLHCLDQLLIADKQAQGMLT